MRGQLGDGTTNSLVEPEVRVGVAWLRGATALAASDAHTCALRTDGAVACWGYNEFGQLGDGTTTDRPTPVVVAGLTGATALAAGSAHTCALLGDGTVACWGANEYGQLGDGTVGVPPSRRWSSIQRQDYLDCSSAFVIASGISDATTFSSKPAFVREWSRCMPIFSV